MMSRKRTAFFWNDWGTVAPLFGLSALVFMFVIGIAIDGSRAYQASSEVTTALDAAAMAAAKELRTNSAASDDDLQLLAENYFRGNLETSGGVGIIFDKLTLKSNRAAGSVTLSVDTRLPTTFSRLLAVNELDIPRSATALDGTRKIELSMMLDLSGSMYGSKISDLKVAASELIKILVGANKVGANNRIAIAPYSTAVNAGPYAGLVTGLLSRNDCVTERTGAYAFADVDPSLRLLNQKAKSCPDSEVMPLTDKESALTKHIEAMQPGGMTAGHLGIAWSWYLLSPEWATVWPSESKPEAYSSDVMKVAIIMTDGEFNTSYESANGNSVSQSEKLCDNMKADGISVYTVAFQAPRNAQQLLKYCASSDNYYFDAQNGENLLQAFREIARRLSLLRLAS